MKLSLILASMVAIAGPAAASCVPQPGLSLQQWYSVCGRDAEYGYSLGGANKPSHEAWIQQLYRMYQSSRPTYNPRLQQMQEGLRSSLAVGQQQDMEAMDRRREGINQNFNNQQDVKARGQIGIMNHIQDTHCVWDDTHTRCLMVPNW